MRIAFFIILLQIISTICSGQTNADILKLAEKKDSKELLKQFFDNWSNEFPPIGQVEFDKLNDTLKETYRVFKAFYLPLNIDSLGGSEWGDEIYKGVNYVIVQNSMKIYFTDKIFYTDAEIDSFIVAKLRAEHKGNDSTLTNLLQRKGGKLSKRLIDVYGPDNQFEKKVRFLVDSIMDFRPPIIYSDVVPLYLKGKYDTILNNFLGDKYYPLGFRTIMTPARSKGESARRKEFLENYVRIWYGHWGGYWQLYSYPVGSITFDKNMEYALVDFRMVYQGGEAILKKEGEKWALISSRLTWIE